MRHEPDSDGEINYHFIFETLRSLGYRGWLGCEYNPKGWLLLTMVINKYPIMRCHSIFAIATTTTTTIIIIIIIIIIIVVVVAVVYA